MRKLLAQLLLGLALTQPALSQTIGAPGGGGGGGGSGTVTSVGTGTGLSGGPITSAGTINCVQGSSSVFGCVKVDGTTITATAGVISAPAGGVSSVAGGCGATPTSPQTGAVTIQANATPILQTTGNIGTGASAVYCGNVIFYNAATDQAPTLPTAASAGVGAFTTVCSIQATQTLTHSGSDTIGITGAATTLATGAGTATAPKCLTFESDGVSVWAISNPPGSGGGITALTGDVTASGSGSVAATVAKIAGVAVGTPTGTGNVVFSASPTLTGTIAAAALTLSGTLTTNVATGTQCLHANSSGVVSGTGSDCGSGGGGGITVGTTTVSGGAAGNVLYTDGSVVQASTGWTYASSVLTNTQALAANTSGDGLVLTNTTAAATGNQRFSPRLHLTGQGWKTTATAASQATDWIVENQPVQGTTTPNTNLVISHQINGGGYVSDVSFTSANPATSNAISLTAASFAPLGMIALPQAGSNYPNPTILTSTSNNTTGMLNYFGQMIYTSAGTAVVCFGCATGVTITNVKAVSWASGTDVTTGGDTALCRTAAGVVEVNNGTCGTFREAKARSYVVGGSAPTLTGTCTTGSQTGGNTAGTFTATCTAQTVIITFAFTAPNGWACNAHDLSTPTDALNQTASSTTTCTLTGTTIASDTISFNAIAF